MTTGFGLFTQMIEPYDFCKRSCYICPFYHDDGVDDCDQEPPGSKASKKRSSDTHTDDDCEEKEENDGDDHDNDIDD